ncbi:MAG: glycosyltransferase family 4 protein [Ferruginibacter sp.]|nr:glycosyltransferase family 4 protein [Ferruginibacter sp.]
MKILHVVESYDPLLHGMQQVVKQLSERLVHLGHTVTVATSYHPERNLFNIKGVDIASFKIAGNAVNGYQATNSEIERYIEFVKINGFQIVTIFAAQQWSCDILLPILDEIPAKKVFVPTGFSQLYNPKYQPYFNNMQTWLKSFDRLIFLSNDYRDINFAKQNGIKNFEIITNGASAEEFCTPLENNIQSELGIPKNHLLVLNVSSHTGLKGHSETIELFKKAKLKNTTLLLIGNKIHNSRLKTFVKQILSVLTPISGIKYFPQCYDSCKRKSFYHNLIDSIKNNNSKILIKDLSRVQILQAYAAADLFLFTSNLECSPIVLFECMASKTPFLTAEVGNAAEIINWSGSGKLLPTIKVNQNYSIVKIDESVRILRELIDNAELRKNMAENGYTNWLNNFTWEGIAKKYERVYQFIL